MYIGWPPHPRPSAQRPELRRDLGIPKLLIRCSRGTLLDLCVSSLRRGHANPSPCRSNLNGWYLEGDACPASPDWSAGGRSRSRPLLLRRSRCDYYFSRTALFPQLHDSVGAAGRDDKTTWGHANNNNNNNNSKKHIIMIIASIHIYLYIHICIYICVHIYIYIYM